MTANLFLASSSEYTNAAQKDSDLHRGAPGWAAKLSLILTPEQIQLRGFWLKLLRLQKLVVGYITFLLSEAGTVRGRNGKGGDP